MKASSSSVAFSDMKCCQGASWRGVGQVACLFSEESMKVHGLISLWRREFTI